MIGAAVDLSLPVIGSEEFIARAESIFPFTYYKDNFIHCGLFNQ